MCSMTDARWLYAKIILTVQTWSPSHEALTVPCGPVPGVVLESSGDLGSGDSLLPDDDEDDDEDSFVLNDRAGTDDERDEDEDYEDDDDDNDEYLS